MKKFTSVLCALALVLSVSAAPQLKSIKNAASADKTMLEKNIVLKAETMKSFDFAKMAKAAKAPAARKAVATETDVNIVGYYATTYYGYLIFALVGDDGTEFYFSFDPDVIPTIEDDVTYTMDDMFAYFCYWYNGDLGVSVDFTEVTFVKHTDANGKIQVEATATDDNGDVWNIDFDENDLPDPPAGGDFVADEIKTATATGLIEYQLFVDDPELTLYVCINLGDGESDVESGKEYTLADMNASYTSLYFGVGTEIEIASISFTKTVAADKSYTIAAEFEDADGNKWTVSASKAAPTEFTIEINKGLQLIDKTATSGWWQILGENDDFSFSLSNGNSVSEISGTFENDDMDRSYTWIRPAGATSRIYFASGSITLTANADETVDAVGAFADADGNVYNFKLHYADPVAETEKTVSTDEAVFTATVFEYGYYSFDGFLIQGIDADGVAVSLDIVTDELVGTYTEADLWGDDAFVLDGGKQTIFTADIEITEDETTRTLTADILCYNNVLYHATLTQEKPEPQNIVISFSGAEVYFEDEIASDDYWLASGTNDDYEVWFSNGPAVTQVAGTYTEADLDPEYTTVEDLATGVKVGFKTITLVVVEQSNGSLHFHAEGVGKDDNNYTIDMQYGDLPSAVDNTNAEVKAVKSIENGQLIINRNGVKFNVVGARIQ